MGPDLQKLCGGQTKGLNMKKYITYFELVSTLHQIDSYMFDIHIKYYYDLNVSTPSTHIINDEDLNFFKR